MPSIRWEPLVIFPGGWDHRKIGHINGPTPKPLFPIVLYQCNHCNPLYKTISYNRKGTYSKSGMCRNPPVAPLGNEVLFRSQGHKVSPLGVENGSKPLPGTAGKKSAFSQRFPRFTNFWREAVGKCVPGIPERKKPQLAVGALSGSRFWSVRSDRLGPPQRPVRCLLRPSGARAQAPG